jgi:PAS domain S-box-containing protein
VRDTHDGRSILDRLPIGVLVYRLNNLIYANRAFLDWTGYPALEALAEAGGLDSLFIETKPVAHPTDAKNGGKTLTITTVNGKQKPVEGRLFSVPWNNENALALMINTQTVTDERATAAEASLRRVEGENHELRAILDTATDGVLVLNRAGRVLSANSSAQALFGYEATDFTEFTFGDLFAPESRRSVLDYLDRLVNGAPAGLLDTGREAIGRVRQGGLVPLYITMGRIEGGEKLCAVLRDITAWKRTEEELINARQQAERASTAKSEFLAKISHEIRTPLNAIIGFSEVMMDERFGPVGNERYRQYLKDIHSSGDHLISLLNDLLDLSKIEAGKLELTFVSVNLNDLVQQCVAIMQQQANRERVIIRTSLPLSLPQIVADARSVRQIALNLLSNSIKFTGAGGQVIVSTALTDDNEVTLRVRDTGIGMSEKELQTALEPFRQLATAARWGSSGTGLGLSITKALAEANHARFRISSQVDEGTLVEVAFPATRVLAQ